jgi:hypothetical protein
MNSFVARKRKPSVAQSMSELVAEGAPPEILLRTSAQRRPTLHLPARPAMTEKSSPNEQALPSKVSYRARARVRAFH